MNKGRILIFGDIMLDVYHLGYINRISPEAPVPVFDEEEVKFSLGGAGNVALNVKSLLPDYQIDLLCVDIVPHLEKIKDSIKDINLIQNKYLQYMIEKHRFIDKRNKQQIGLRYDKISPRYKFFIQDFNLIKDIDYDLIVFSDYDKGSFDDALLIQQILYKAKKENILTILDSKSNNLTKFNGVEIFKPNNKEFEIYLNKKTFDFKYVIRTESENGITLYDNKNNEMLHFPSYVNDVVSTVGAGDTALAGLVYGMSQKYPIRTAIMYANFLAGQACLHPGTYVVTQEDLKNAKTIIHDEHYLIQK